jgi:hypothetical protein
MELSIAFPDMESEIDKMATTFLDLIGLQSSKTTATSILIILIRFCLIFEIFSQRTLFGIFGFIM